MPSPNFFLIGAPKCGTTAMSVYLGEHPEIFFCRPKEPCFWSDDMPGIRQHHGIRTSSDYLDLFANANSSESRIGEGSTNYLVSETAIPNILEFDPNAKFVAMLRHPVDLVHSLHHHNFFSGWDDQPSLAKAWELQAQRTESNCHPDACLNPVMLQYRKVASLGDQIERLFDWVDPKNRLILLYDDFRESPGSTYRRALSFLDVSDDHRTTFPAVNQSMAPRMRWLKSLAQSKSSRRLARVAKRFLPEPVSAMLASSKKALTTRSQKKADLDDEFRSFLIEEFTDDVGLLSDLLQRDLKDWQR